MTFPSIAEIKKELQHTDAEVLLSLCLRLAKYKKENKELLGYLLFESQNESSYVRQIKEDIDTQFDELKGKNAYILKKMLRKILRFTNRHIKYSSVAETELELRIYFCQKVKDADIPLKTSPTLYNLYHGQLKKIEATLAKLPEDIQGDYANAIEIIR
jgi:hypothetical protein